MSDEAGRACAERGCRRTRGTRECLLGGGRIVNRTDKLVLIYVSDAALAATSIAPLGSARRDRTRDSAQSTRIDSLVAPVPVPSPAAAYGALVLI